MYIWVVTWTKISIILLYLRIFPAKEFRRQCYVLMALTILVGLSCTIVFPLACRPISYMWKGWDGTMEAKCININADTFAFAAINMTLDVAIFAAPIFQVCKRFNLLIAHGAHSTTRLRNYRWTTNASSGFVSCSLSADCKQLLCSPFVIRTSANISSVLPFVPSFVYPRSWTTGERWIQPMTTWNSQYVRTRMTLLSKSLVAYCTSFRYNTKMLRWRDISQLDCQKIWELPALILPTGSALEIQVGVICACIPGIATLLRRIWPNIFDTGKGSSDPSSSEASQENKKPPRVNSAHKKHIYSKTSVSVAFTDRNKVAHDATSTRSDELELAPHTDYQQHETHTRYSVDSDLRNAQGSWDRVSGIMILHHIERMKSNFNVLLARWFLNPSTAHFDTS